MHCPVCGRCESKAFTNELGPGIKVCKGLCSQKWRHEFRPKTGKKPQAPLTCAWCDKTLSKMGIMREDGAMFCNQGCECLRAIAEGFAKMTGTYYIPKYSMPLPPIEPEQKKEGFSNKKIQELVQKSFDHCSKQYWDRIEKQLNEEDSKLEEIARDTTGEVPDKCFMCGREIGETRLFDWPCKVRHDNCSQECMDEYMQRQHEQERQRKWDKRHKPKETEE